MADIAGETVVQAEVPAQTVGISPAARSLDPNTTAQQDLTTAGQRKVNLIWEYTQAAVAIIVVISTMAAGLYSMLYSVEIPNLIGVAFGMITGFYFSRTNHQAIGGTGEKPEQAYIGR